jgi:hypothetical protein
MFNDDGTLKRELFGTVNVKIVEMDRGYKPDTVFYGICEFKKDYNIVVKYGLGIKGKKNMIIGRIYEINPLDIVESDATRKNEELLKKWTL